MKKEQTESVAKIVEAIHEKKGRKVTVIDLTKVDGAMADVFVICQGSSSRNVEAIADSVLETLEERPRGKDGFDTARWILLDYFDIIVHIFQPDAREFYNLEGLWKEGGFREIEENEVQ